jgi:hypothetical protein
LYVQYNSADEIKLLDVERTPYLSKQCNIPKNIFQFISNPEKENQIANCNEYSIQPLTINENLNTLAAVSSAVKNKKNNQNNQNNQNNSILNSNLNFDFNTDQNPNNKLFIEKKK